LDLSLTGAAACAIRPGWKGDWSQLATKRVGYPLAKNPRPRETVDRLDTIARELVDFAELHGVTDAFVEGYAFSMVNSRSHALGEVGGAVKLDFRRRLDLVLHTVAPNTARKLLCGKVPAKKTSGVEPKRYVQRWLIDLGADFATDDEGDAFVIANYGRREVGLPAMVPTC
jgi:Holliday junction resolvasome RuvABC endonuclease subunit